MRNFFSQQMTSSTIALLGILASCGPSQPELIKTTLQTPDGPVTFLAAPNGHQINKVIGKNDLVKVMNDGANIPEKYRPLIDAFGKISMGCSATHIGNGLVLTAGHCFDAPERRTNNQPCSEFTIAWGLRHDKAAYLTSRCDMILAAETSNDRDYAILRVSPIPPVSVELDLTARPNVDLRITIFGHPQARPLEWSQTCGLRTSEEGGWGRFQFSHQCDTEPGNSGSTVLDDSSLKVIGIHDGGRILDPGANMGWNYATFLADTPIREFVGGNPLPDPTPTPVPQPGDDQSFGPFENSENRILTTLSKKEGEAVSFRLEVDTEKNYDKVVVTTGTGEVKQYSGKHAVEMDKLPTPVTIQFISDRSVKSTRVQLKSISFSN
jgi:V8-like Glu-specific endopeptidase